MRKYFSFLVALCLIAMIVTGCSMMGMKKGPNIIGTWKGVNPEGGNITMTFREDMTLLTLIDSPNGEMSVDGKYKIDQSVQPNTFDFYDIRMPDIPEAEGGIFLGIFEFKTSNTMLLNGVFQQPGMTETRPTSFDGRTIEYTRVK